MDTIKKAYAEGELHKLTWTLDFFQAHVEETWDWLLPAKREFCQTCSGDLILERLFKLAETIQGWPNITLRKKMARGITCVIRAIMLEICQSPTWYCYTMQYLAACKAKGAFGYYMALYDPEQVFINKSTSVTLSLTDTTITTNCLAGNPNYNKLRMAPHPIAVCMTRDNNRRRYIDYTKNRISHQLKAELSAAVPLI